LTVVETGGDCASIHVAAYGPGTRMRRVNRNVPSARVRVEPIARPPAEIVTCSPPAGGTRAPRNVRRWR
jgi:hypothetical protein